MIKVITGYKEDQYCLIDFDEAHKAYYLFSNPEARTIFKNGAVLIGKNIIDIKPAWNELMGWNPAHILNVDDWTEINQSGLKNKVENILIEAKGVAKIAESQPNLLSVSLLETRALLLE